MRTRVSSRGRIILPAEVRRRDEVEAGQDFEIERLGRGDYRLVRRNSPPSWGLVAWLLALLPRESRMLGKDALGKYRLLRQIGSGGNASVFLAAPLNYPNRRVVVKRIHDHIAANPRFRDIPPALLPG